MFQGIGAGFECATIGARCLATETRHTPEGDMAAHYRIALDHGCTWARDGLPPERNIRERMAEAYARCEPQVVFDLCHYWALPDPAGYATAVGRAHMSLRPSAPLWVCPINEAAFHGIMREGEDKTFLAYLAGAMVAVLRAQGCNVRVMTAEPAHSVSDLDGHFCWQHADVIGLNMHACHLRQAPHEIMIEAARRFRKPMVVAETSLHVGHPANYLGINSKAEWLGYMLDEVGFAFRHGAEIEGICWHPFVDSPSWADPAEGRWDHGLIRADLSVDPSLSQVICEATGAELRRSAA